MKPRRKLLLLAVPAALLAGCGSSANKATGARELKPVVLTLANWQIGDSDVGEWTRAVERLSDGAVRIEIRGGWRRDELENDRGTLGDVRAGRIDIGHIPARAWDTLGVGSFRALDAPLLVDSLELQERVVTSDVGAGMLDGVRAAGVEPLVLMPGPLRRPVGMSNELLGPADYRGALIGLRPSALQEATMRALGARVARYPAFRTLDGADGTELDIAALDLDTDVYWEQARSVTTNVVLWPRATTLVMNRERWTGLTDAQRAVLQDAARAAVAPRDGARAQVRAWRHRCPVRSRLQARARERRPAGGAAPGGSAGPPPARERRRHARGARAHPLAQERRARHTGPRLPCGARTGRPCAPTLRSWAPGRFA